MSAEPDYIDSIAVYTCPQKQTPDSGPWFLAALAFDPDQKGPCPIDDKVIPPDWDLKFTPHYIPISDMCPPMNAKWMADNQITHLALLEGPMPDCDPMYFGGKAITHNGLMLWFSETKKMFVHFHCRQCVTVVLQWLVEHQEQWAGVKSTLN